MGVWFLATALSGTVAMRLGKMAAIDEKDIDTRNINDMVATYTQLFEFLMWVGLGTGILLLLISPLLKRGMHGIR